VWRASGTAELIVVVGALRAECGVLAAGQWLPGSLRDVPFDLVQGVAGAMTVPAAAIEQLAQGLRAWREGEPGADPARHRIATVRVLVSEVWLAAAAVPWSDSLKDGARAQAFARAQLAAAGHAVDTSDLVKLDDAPFARPRLAVAYPATLMASLAQLADQLGARLASVLPIGVAAWHGLPAPHRGGMDALAVIDEGMLLVAHGERRLGELSLRTQAARADSGASTLQSLRDHWQRMRLRDPQLAAVRRLRVLALTPDATLPAASDDIAPVEWAPVVQPGCPSLRLQLAALPGSQGTALDAVQARPELTPLRAAAAGLALMVAAASLWQAWRTSEQAQDLSQQVSAARQQGQAPRPARMSREETARVQAVNAAIRELNFPVAALLRALQPPADIPVAVLSVDLSGAAAGEAPRDAVVKITAEARSGAAMARYVGFVAERKPFSGAYLTHHEIAETVPERPYRFTVEAAWSP